jgi:hypothetical protein
MRTARILAEVCGWFVLLLFVAGVLGLGEFQLVFIPH